jgi:probable F420-dependent oxidoreductase
MELSVVVRARERGASPDEALAIAVAADELGFGELWVGEGPAWDAFVLATAVGMETREASLTVGPVPASVRDPATIARGAASVAAVTGRAVGVALGTASVRVVEKLHGRSRRRPISDLAETARVLREIIDIDPEGRFAGDPDARFLGQFGAPTGPLTVAAFGDRAIGVAAAYADRMLLDLVTPEQVRLLRSKLGEAVGESGSPQLAAWLPVALDPPEQARREVLETIAGYLTVGGYREMFIEAGFDEAVAKAASGAGAEELMAALPDEAPSAVGLVGGEAQVAERMDAYASAGLDEIAVVPVTSGDPGGERTLRRLHSLM